jgi:CBS-domain-containing membrane protein
MHAEDIMARSILSIRRDASWREALQLLLGDACNAAPVVDEERHLVGIITQADLATRTTEDERLEMHNTLDGILCVRPPHTLLRWHTAPHWEGTSTVEMIMTASAVTAYAETPVAEVAQLLLDHRIAQVPIVDGVGVLLGMVTRQEIITAVAVSTVNPLPPMEEAFAAWANA